MNNRINKELEIPLIKEDPAYWHKEAISPELFDLEEAKSKRIVYLIEKSFRSDDLRTQELVIKIIQNLMYQESLPNYVIFMNQWIKLLVMNSKLEESLSFLDQQGVKLLTSIDCLEAYLNPDDRILDFIERASIHEINSILIAADSVVSF